MGSPTIHSQKCVSMMIFITLLIFSAAFLAAAEYAWWAPERRTRQEIEIESRETQQELAAKKLRAIPEYADKEIVSRITNKILTPMPYSEI